MSGSEEINEKEDTSSSRCNNIEMIRRVWYLVNNKIKIKMYHANIDKDNEWIHLIYF